MKPIFSECLVFASTSLKNFRTWPQHCFFQFQGPVLCWFHAIEAYQKTGVDLPVNLKVIFLISNNRFYLYLFYASTCRTNLKNNLKHFSFINLVLVHLSFQPSRCIKASFCNCEEIHVLHVLHFRGLGITFPWHCFIIILWLIMVNSCLKGLSCTWYCC